MKLVLEAHFMELLTAFSSPAHAYILVRQIMPIGLFFSSSVSHTIFTPLAFTFTAAPNT